VEDSAVSLRLSSCTHQTNQQLLLLFRLLTNCSVRFVRHCLLVVVAEFADCSSIQLTSSKELRRYRSSVVIILVAECSSVKASWCVCLSGPSWRSRGGTEVGRDYHLHRILGLEFELIELILSGVCVCV